MTALQCDFIEIVKTRTTSQLLSPKPTVHSMTTSVVVSKPSIDLFLDSLSAQLRTYRAWIANDHSDTSILYNVKTDIRLLVQSSTDLWLGYQDRHSEKPFTETTPPTAYFTKLPIELQQKIWRYSFPTQRVVHVKSSGDTSKIAGLSIPAAFLVDRISLECAKKFYHPIAFLSGCHSTLLNKAMDIFYLSTPVSDALLLSKVKSTADIMAYGLHKWTSLNDSLGMSIAVDFCHLQTAREPGLYWARFLGNQKFESVLFVLDGDVGVRMGSSFTEAEEQSGEWESFLQDLKMHWEQLWGKRRELPRLSLVQWCLNT